MIVKEPDGGGFEKPPVGNHVGICYEVVDVGTQPRGDFAPRRVVILQWELPDEKMTDGRPMTIQKMYTASLSAKANLRHDLESWRSRPFTPDELKGFDLRNVLGVSAMINVAHTDDGKYANVTAVTSVPKALAATKREPVNPIVYFSLENPDWTVFAGLSEYLQNKIADAPEYKALRNAQPRSAETSAPKPANAPGLIDDPMPDFEDDIPF